MATAPQAAEARAPGMDYQNGQICEATVTQITKKGTLICHLLQGKKIREISIHGIIFNAKTNAPFVSGDIVKIMITNVNPLEASLTKEYVRPLLIFDMHGVLGEREPWEKRRKDGKRRFIKRPYCEEFIRFCANHFELAVWSCGKKKNIDLNIFSGIKLLFVWCQDESTNLYPRTSCVSSEKPLFLKELSRVWETFCPFDASNTLLLENHIEKCENNPFGTCMIVPDFIIGSVGDEVLNPTGELARELLTIAVQANISQYLSQRAGSSSFFPTSYLPSPQNVESVTLPSPAPVSRASSESSTSRQLLSMLTGNSISHSSSQKIEHFTSTIISSVCESFRENPHCHLRVIHDKLLESPPTLIPSSNSALFLLSPQYSELCFITAGANSSDYRLEYLFVVIEKQAEWAEWINTLGGVSVIDGKLFYDHQRKIRKFLCHDIAIMNGTDLISSPDYTLRQRQELLGVWLFDSPFDENILGSIEFVLDLDGTS